MLDSSCSETPKTKKKTAQNRPVQRFWPDSIASGAAQPPSGDLAMSEGTGWGQGRGDTAGRWGDVGTMGCDWSLLLLREREGCTLSCLVLRLRRDEGLTCGRVILGACV